MAEPRGVIRMSSPPGMLCFVVGAQIARFMARYPGVRVDLESTSRRIDVVREGFDLAVRVRFPRIEDSDLVVRTLSRSPQRLMAAPALFEDRPRPAVPGDLSGLPSLDWERPQHTHSWCLDGPEGGQTRIDHSPHLVTDDLAMLSEAALAGLGVVQLPLLIGGADLEAGHLVDVLPGWAPREGVVQAIFPSRRGLLPAVRALIDFMAASFGESDFSPS